VRTGLDRLATHPKLGAELRGARVGLLAHPAAVDRRLVHARTILDALGVLVALVLGPEHGYGGEAQDMIGVSDARDAFGTRVRSLYGESPDDLAPSADDLAQIDVLVIDLQDVGARYYTFVWTAVLAMRACARAGVRVLVLDRPNPLGGDVSRIEGRRQSRAFCSFVGLEPVPIRHSLTLGEIARDRVGQAVRTAVAQHADLRDRARLPRRVPRRRDQPLRGAGHDASVRDRGGALD
jgi:uncharacterized protein YbbC (DUF1343 family)